MRKNRKNKKSSFRNREMIHSNEPNLDETSLMKDEYDESARLKMIAIIFSIPLFLFIGYIFTTKYNIPQDPEKIEAFKETQQAKKNEKNSIESQKITQGADGAFKSKDYIKAVFLYRQAISYQTKDINLYKKLLLALEASCENENTFHCDSIEKTKNKLEILEEGN